MSTYSQFEGFQGGSVIYSTVKNNETVNMHLMLMLQ